MQQTPTKQQIEQWKKAQRLAKALNMYVQALALRGKALNTAALIGQRHGIIIPGIDGWLMRIAKAQERDAKIQNTIAAIHTGRLGLRGSIERPGDLDVMAPAGTPDDALMDYYTLGFPWIILGVVVAVGLIAALVHEHRQASELRNVYKPLKNKADNLLCSDPRSGACAEWIAAQKEVEFEARKSTWEKIESGAKTVVGGAKIGLMIAVPIAALVLFSWLKKPQ